MAAYCEREDVVRWLGGTLESARSHLGARLWQLAVEPFTVDGNTFDMPTTALLRIDSYIITASSRLLTAILQAYQAEPTVIPDHVRLAAAKLAARDCCADDGVLTDRIRRGVEEADAVFGQIAAKQLDLGIVAPRPAYRGPTVQVIPLASTMGAGAWRCR